MGHFTRCKESQFYSLPFGQAVATVACTSPQVISTSPKTLFDQQDWLQSFCNLNFPKRLHLPVGQVKNKNHPKQGAKKIIFTACHSGKLKLAFTSPDVISTSPKTFLTSRIIDVTVFLLFEFLKKHYLLSGKLKTEFTSPIANYFRHYFLCTLLKQNQLAPGYQTRLSLHADFMLFKLFKKP